LPASPFFSKVHPGLKVPLNTLYLNLALVIIFGLIFLGSSSAFNAIVSASVVLLDLAYGIPIAINCIRGRNTLPERSFVLPNVLGWVLNIVRIQIWLFPFSYERKLTEEFDRSRWSTFPSPLSSSSSLRNSLPRAAI
jgi:amino acid transporter